MSVTYSTGYRLANDEQLFRWQFHDRSRGGDDHYHLKLALLDGQIVGCLGYIPVEIVMDHGRYRGAWTANWIVDPAQRRLGIGPLLLRELMNSVDVTAAVGLGSAACSILPRMGWTDYGTLARYVAVLDVLATSVLCRQGSLDWPAGRLPTAAASRVAVDRVTRFDADAGALWERLSGQLGAASTRSTEFLNWRYAEHPVFKYQLFAARIGGKLAGLAVYRIEQVRERTVRVGRLLELIAEPDSADALIRAVIVEAQRQDLAFVDFFCASLQHDGVLRRWGMRTAVDAPVDQIPMLLQPVDHGRTQIEFMAHFGRLKGPVSREQWYVTKGDGDQDRPN